MILSHLSGLNTPVVKALLSGVVLSIAQIELKIATTRLGETIQLFGSSSHFSMNMRIWHGILFIIFAATGVILWITALRHSELSRIYWTTAICYLVVPLASSYVLGDLIESKNIIGYIFITIGLFLANHR
ncbi:4-amino-4-deoxy-L-arabinose-phosphoundecaprenol flippase subunit ArnF [Synechococcus sp. MIT S9508]|nr:4-amino-4-deoxy-L-arabinose-phosphoundecaprenol flippase subunit ArnF [Synechococcus sp. MIT S9508]